MDYSQISAEAERLLEILSATSFEDCCPLTKQFSHLMVRPGLYAIRHRIYGILYVGKSANIRERFKQGHKALVWAFIDRLHPDDVRIAATPVGFEWHKLLYELEGIVIRQVRPPYNIRIPRER